MNALLPVLPVSNKPSRLSQSDSDRFISRHPSLVPTQGL